MKLINLLPDSEQNLIKKENFLRSLRAVFILALASYVLVAGILLLARVFLEQNANDLQNKIAQQKQTLQNQDQIQQDVQKDNAIITDYVVIAGKNPQWSKALSALADLVPPDVAIANLSADTATGKIEIQGQSPSRDSVLQLRANIAESPMFKNIDLPLGNLEKPADLQFHYTFYLNQGAITAAGGGAK